MQLDIKRAFDNINHDVLVGVLKSYGVPSRIILSIMRELTSCNMHISLQGLEVKEPVLLSLGGKQGGSETPSLWVRLADRAAQNASARWN